MGHIEIVTHLNANFSHVLTLCVGGTTTIMPNEKVLCEVAKSQRLFFPHGIMFKIPGSPVIISRLPWRLMLAPGDYRLILLWFTLLKINSLYTYLQCHRHVLFLNQDPLAGVDFQFRLQIFM